MFLLLELPEDLEGILGLGDGDWGAPCGILGTGLSVLKPLICWLWNGQWGPLGVSEGPTGKLPLQSVGFLAFSTSCSMSNLAKALYRA